MKWGAMLKMLMGAVGYHSDGRLQHSAPKIEETIRRQNAIDYDISLVERELRRIQLLDLQRDSMRRDTRG